MEQKNKPLIFPLFSKVVYVKQTNIDCKKILHLIKEPTMVSGENKKNKKYLLLSSINKEVLNQVKFKNLKKEIMKEFYEYAHQILHYENNKFKMTTSWFVESNSGQKSGYHNHNNCMFSGCLYLKVNKNSGGINFNNYENFRFLLNPTRYDTLNARDFIIQPETGTIIFFPSEMYHRVLENKSNEKRISLAFNFFPVGHLGGTGDSKANIK